MSSLPGRRRRGKIIVLTLERFAIIGVRMWFTLERFASVGLDGDQTENSWPNTHFIKNRPLVYNRFFSGTDFGETEKCEPCFRFVGPMQSSEGFVKMGLRAPKVESGFAEKGHGPNGNQTNVLEPIGGCFKYLNPFAKTDQKYEPFDKGANPSATG